MVNRSFSLSFKARVVRHREEHNITQTALKFNIDRKLVRNWCNQKDDILSHCLTRDRRRVVKHIQPKFPHIDNSVLEWVNEQRDNGRLVSGKMVRDHALSI